MIHTLLKIRKIYLAYFIALMTFPSAIYANTTQAYPEVGKPCPFFKLLNVEYYKNKEITLTELKGKYVLLDFFASGCEACFESFPKMNHLHSEFSSKLEMFIIGKTDPEIKKTFEKCRVREHLDFPVCYDSSLFKRFVSAYIPHIIWIDPEGIVVAITSGSDVTEANVAKFISGQSFENNDISEKTVEVISARRDSIRKSSNKFSLFGANTNDTTLLYQSFLKRSVMGDPRVLPASIKESLQYISPRKFEVVGAPITLLYQYAFIGEPYIFPEDSLYGKFWLPPIVETYDKSIFEPHFSSSTLRNIFTYSLIVPSNKANPENIEQIMKGDLKNYFGYDVHIEKRKMPCWFLTASDEARIKLRSKGGDSTKSTFSYAELNIINVPIITFITTFANGFGFKQPPFIDRTGITSNIDIHIDALLTDINAIRKELKRNGLGLEKGEVEMNVIVIRDPPKDNH